MFVKLKLNRLQKKLYHTSVWIESPDLKNGMIHILGGGSDIPIHLRNSTLGQVNRVPYHTIRHLPTVTRYNNRIILSEDENLGHKVSMHHLNIFRDIVFTSYALDADSAITGDILRAQASWSLPAIKKGLNVPDSRLPDTE